MKSVFNKLKIAETLITNLQVQPTDFVQKLSTLTDKGSTSFIFDIFDLLSPSLNNFKGIVNSEGFEIKIKRHLLGKNKTPNVAIATGKFIRKNNRVVLETKINGFNDFFLFYYLVLLIICSIQTFSQDLESTLVFVFCYILAFIIPFYIMRSSVRVLKESLMESFAYINGTA